MIGIGRRSARGRIAHLLCEVLTRLKAVGLAEELSCELPITQSDLGDALGLSVVHVNRVLQELRGEGLITLRGKLLVVNDWTGLEAAGQFDIRVTCFRLPVGGRPARGATSGTRTCGLLHHCKAQGAQRSVSLNLLYFVNLGPSLSHCAGNNNDKRLRGGSPRMSAAVLADDRLVADEMTRILRQRGHLAPFGSTRS